MKNRFTKSSRRSMALLALLGGTALTTQAQVGIGTTTPDASAVLELSTTNKGLLLPRLTLAQRNAIQSPAAGLMIYQTDNTPGLYLYGGSTWSLLPSATQTTGDNLGNHTASQNLQLGGNMLLGNGSTEGYTITSNGFLRSSTNNVVLGGGSTGQYLTGAHNVLMGWQAGREITSGFFNTILGAQAGQLLTTGVQNALVGTNAGRFLQNSSGNAALGMQALELGTTGFGNVGVGFQAGRTNSTGTYLTLLGTSADVTTDGLTNATAIGYNARVSASHSLVLGGTGTDAVKVGIGTATPATTLHVAGSSSTVRLEGLAGSGTRVVTTDASGNLGTTALPTDAQQLSVSGSTLSISGGNSVTLPTGTDNLGNHTATQALNLGTHQLVGNGGSAGLSISSAGEVGVGTSSAGSRLGVAGGLAVDADGSYDGNFTSGGNVLRFGTGSSGEGIGSPRMSGTNTNGLSFYTNYNTRLSITNGGNLGVGTSNPNTKLDVWGGIAIDGGGVFNGNFTSSANMLRFGPSNSGEGIGSTRLGSTNAYGLDFYTLYTSRLSITGTGNVGIGTRTPTATLHVASSGASIRFEPLAGTDTRMVTADASGNLSTATLPTDAQTLSISGSTISLTNGGSVTVPAAADNLGNHTATQNLSLNSTYDLILRDSNHGLGWYGTGKTWTAGTAQSATAVATSVDGPVLYGYNAGLLGTNFGGTRTTALSWNRFGQVGIATTNPQATFHVAGTAGTANVRLESLGNTANAVNVVTADASGNLNTTTTASLADNLGNHTATTNLNLAAHKLVGNGGTSGLNISAAGVVTTDNHLGIADKDLYLRTTSSLADSHHGLGWYGTGKTWNAGTAQSATAVATSVDGPVLYGYTAGVLGTNVSGSRTTALYWNNAGRVGIATTSPTSTFEVNGSEALAMTTSGTAATFTLGSTHRTVRRTAATNTTIALPAASASPGRLYTLINSLTSSVSLTTTSGSVRDDAYVTGYTNGNPTTSSTTLTSLAANTRLTVQSDGTDWIVISR